LEEAIAAHEQAQECWQSSSLQIASERVACSQSYIGELYYALGKPEEGDVHLADALEHFNTRAAALPDELYTIQPLVVFLCMCPNRAMRDPERAVRMAERFIGVCDSSGPFWRYLALARYCAGDWSGAEEAIDKCMKLRGGDALDWLLLGATQFGGGRHVEAARSFDSAQAAIAAGEPIYYGEIGVLGYEQLRAEAERLLH
jgi:tetratricopeptide (TPR) repeat protein